MVNASGSSVGEVGIIDPFYQHLIWRVRGVRRKIHDFKLSDVIVSLEAAMGWEVVYISFRYTFRSLHV